MSDQPAEAVVDVNMMKESYNASSTPTTESTIINEQSNNPPNDQSTDQSTEQPNDQSSATADEPSSDQQGTHKPLSSQRAGKKRNARVLEPWQLTAGPWKKEKKDEQSTEQPTKRLPKRHVCLLFGYNGSQYMGSQIQTGTNVKTVESDLVAAIYEAGGMLEENRDQLTKLKWMRSARTDRGVHAAVNCISANLIVEPNAQEFVQRINSHLPKQIRAFTTFRVTQGFHAKYACSSREYHYLVPAYVFEPSFNQHVNANICKERGIQEELRRQMKDARKLARELMDESKNGQSSNPSPPPQQKKKNKDDSDDEIEEPESDDETNQSTNPTSNQSNNQSVNSDERDDIELSDELKAALTSYRLSDDHLKLINDLLHTYTGSHNYYNFTRHKVQKDREQKKKYLDIVAQNEADFASTMSEEQRIAYQAEKLEAALQRETTIPVAKDFNASRNQRFMKSVEVASLVEHRGMQFVLIRIHGQSFMINQIRKMIGLVVGCARKLIDSSAVIPAVFNQSNFVIPVAPALGLYLNRMYFDGYDKKCKGLEQSNNQLDEARPAVGEELTAHQTEIEEFRRAMIEPAICDVECDTFAAYRWIASLGLHPSICRTKDEIEAEQRELQAKQPVKQNKKQAVAASNTATTST